MFEIHDLVMTDFGFDRAAAFEARLSNWKPAGEIHAKGTFGPWNTTDPRMTTDPVAAARRAADVAEPEFGRYFLIHFLGLTIAYGDEGPMVLTVNDTSASSELEPS